jgi:deoxyribodipyrimidine photo-lyase
MTLGLAKCVPDDRIETINSSKVNQQGDYVLYWMSAYRRTARNFALQRAVEWAEGLGLPLLIVESIRIDEPWASVRFHRFVLDGMVSNSLHCVVNGVRYFAFVERKVGERDSFFGHLAENAAVITMDYFPCMGAPVRQKQLVEELGRRVESVDSNGILPLTIAPGSFSTAYSFRCFLQKNIVDHLSQFPQPEPLALLSSRPLVDKCVAGKFKVSNLQELSGPLEKSLDIDQSVGCSSLSGGAPSGQLRIQSFFNNRLSSYMKSRMNASPEEGTSGLSGYLHFGHVGAHCIVHPLLDRFGWDADQIKKVRSGSREGWWGLPKAIESFLDQIITWRELGYVFSHHRPDDYDRFESLPDWAQDTLESHSKDFRPCLYSMNALENAMTDDDIWNAAQRQLVHEGWMHNYLRMLWGKRILEWSDSPREALRRMIVLNNRFAIDGRNPNSYSGIFWVLGRFDRPWGPKRPIYGSVRYMSSERTRKKMDLSEYIQHYGGHSKVEDSSAVNG